MPPTNVRVNQLDTNSPNSDNNTTQSETSIAVFGSTVVVAYNDTRQFAIDGYNGSFQGYSYSSDGGLTFTDAGQLNPPAGLVCLSDPILGVDSAGNFYFATLCSDLYRGITTVAVAKSTSISPNVTFGTPVNIPNLSPSVWADKEWMAIDTTGGTYNDRIYLAWTEFGAGKGRILFTRSISTSPLNFQNPIALTLGDAMELGANIAIGPNGEVYLAWGRFDDPNESFHMLKSTDGGATFINPDPGDPSPTKVLVNPTAAAYNMVSGGINIRTRDFPYVAVDKTSGTDTTGYVYVVFQAKIDPLSSDRGDIFFTRSIDGGASWSLPIPINKVATINADTTSNDNWQPSIAVSPTSGQITVTFYDRRGDSSNLLITLFKAISTDAGMTWLTEQVSSEAFTPNTNYDPFEHDAYMGDYNSIFSDGTNFHMAWGDCRNLCTPPPGATNPCSLAGRSDQDVFYAKVAQLSGPDLAITPWGLLTGVGPTWQSPDIFVVDSMNSKVNAVKGQINNLRAHIRNVGNASATGVIVRFKYAPWFAGLADAALKEMGTVSVNLFPSGDPSGDDDKIVPINWDLTDLTDTNGGMWPMPISAFVHFCVKVSLEFSGDVNLSNNIAQTNFFDVPTINSATRFPFIIGNPFDHEVEAILISKSTNEKFKVKIIESDIKIGRPFKLRPNEIRIVKFEFIPPKGIGKSPPDEDVIVQISLNIEQSIVGGISARMYESGKNKRMFSAKYDEVFDVILKVLEEKNESVSLADRDRGHINTGSIEMAAERLAQIVDKKSSALMANLDGRYLITFYLRKVDLENTTVTVNPLIIVKTESASHIGGRIVISNGTLEKEHLDAIARKLLT